MVDGQRRRARPVDAIVVMGAAQYDGEPSPVLAARLDHVVDLWPQGLAPLVVVTGGKRPEDRFTEAEASAAYLVERGVPAEAIVLEDEGANSVRVAGGRQRAARGARARRGAHRHRPVPLAAQPDHRRGRRPAGWASPTPYSVVDGGESFGRHLQEAAGVALGRLIGFDNL